MTKASAAILARRVEMDGAARLLPTRPSRHYTDHVATFGPLPSQESAGLVGVVSDAGLLGRGGAGFPTGRKMTSVAAHSTRRRAAVVVANCCEGDPTSAKDAVLLAASPHLVLDGAVLAAQSVGADRVIMAVHRHSRTAATLRAAVAERVPETAEVLVAEVPARFVASEATALVRFLNTGDARPLGRQSAIWESGVNGRPTLVDNAETLAHLALIARFGASWFRSVGAAEEPGTTLVTVGGAVPNPGVVEVATGTPLGAITAATGWAPPAHSGAAWALIGGLAGRWIDLRQTAGAGFSTAGLAGIGASKGVASITVLPAGGCLLNETARILQFLADSGARQCGPCMFGLPAIAADMTALSRADPEAFTRLNRRLPVIDKRGGCGHPDGAVAMSASALRAMTGSEPTHLEVHTRYGACNAPAPLVPLGETGHLHLTARP